MSPRMCIYVTYQSNVQGIHIQNRDDIGPESVWAFSKRTKLLRWFQNLYRFKGGRGVFEENVYVEINMMDIQNLKQSILSNTFANTEEYFFAENEEPHRLSTLNFIKVAEIFLTNQARSQNPGTLICTCEES